jgi:hypothetical protein
MLCDGVERVVRQRSQWDLWVELAFQPFMVLPRQPLYRCGWPYPARI